MNSERLQRSAFVHPIERGELALLRIQHPLFQAVIALQGAQLLQFKPSHEDEWLWLSEQATYQHQQSVRGGIPICWPWFGALDQNPLAVRDHYTALNAPPAHGFVRQQHFTLTHLHEACDHLTLTLSWHDEYPDWQGNARLDVTFTLRANALNIALTTHNLGDQPLAVSQALHTYFPTCNIHRTQVHGLKNSDYIDTLRHWQHYRAESVLSFQQETDRIYTTNDRPSVSLITPKHRYVLRSENSNSLAIWNPWSGKAQRLTQFADDAWQRMVCLETGQVADDFRQLAVNESSTVALCLTRD